VVESRKGNSNHAADWRKGQGRNKHHVLCTTPACLRWPWVALHLEEVPNLPMSAAAVGHDWTHCEWHSYYSTLLCLPYTYLKLLVQCLDLPCPVPGWPTAKGPMRHRL